MAYLYDWFSTMNMHYFCNKKLYVIRKKTTEMAWSSAHKDLEGTSHLHAATINFPMGRSEASTFFLER